MKITLTNCFEILKPEIPHLTSSEEYGKWFADHTHNWSAKEIARFNSIHVEQIINCHDNVSQIANGHKIQKAIREAGVFDPNTAGKSGRYHDNWNGKLQDMIRAYNQWDEFERQDTTYMHISCGNRLSCRTNESKLLLIVFKTDTLMTNSWCVQ